MSAIRLSDTRSIFARSCSHVTAFPLRHHFEQNVHVRHRLQNYKAGRCMDFDAATPDLIAEAIADEIGRPTSYEPVETDGADRAATLIAELL